MDALSLTFAHFASLQFQPSTNLIIFDQMFAPTAALCTLAEPFGANNGIGFMSGVTSVYGLPRLDLGSTVFVGLFLKYLKYFRWQ